MVEAAHWKRLMPLGAGGQSTVHLVQSPERSAELDEACSVIHAATHGPSDTPSFIEAMRVSLRPNLPSELGALKVFDKMREEGAAPIARLSREIQILSQGYQGLPKLLASNVDEKWLITEYFPQGSLDKSISFFAGDASRSLGAFRSIVETVAHLHKESVIHRDIKPANVFIAGEQSLVLGDFGIAHKAVATERVTITNERVGPWDYMPQWADTGERLEEVTPPFDVYMLGKLLWCMVSGRLRLPREWHRNSRYDLAMLFPGQKGMTIVNNILDLCLSDEESKCLPTADILLEVIDQAITDLPSNLSINKTGHITMTCSVCQRGTYVEMTDGGRVEINRYNENNVPKPAVKARIFSCNICTHEAFFSLQYPERALSALRK